MSLQDQKNVRSLIYLIETADQKKPPEWTLGGRYLHDQKINGIYDQRSNSKTDGHINRNIRLMSSLLEMMDPSISVIGFSKVNNTTSIFWKVLGCTESIDKIQHVYLGEPHNFYKH
jgi:hypothetical protein